MSVFEEALIGPGEIQPDPKNPFGPLVGQWDFEWVDQKGQEGERHVKGEWIFSWILEGKVIQDLFICPSRQERNINPQPDAEYGTTVRFYNKKKDKWDICYGFHGKMIILEAEQVGEEIILVNQNQSDGLNQWVFSKITPIAFHWQNRTSHDGGKTWRINGQLSATRRNG